MKFDAVIFDLFGTLVYPCPSSKSRELQLKIAETLDLDFEGFHRIWYETRHERARGMFGSSHETLQMIASKLGSHPEWRAINEAVRSQILFFKERLTPRSEAIPLLRTLKSRGLRTGLLSDCTIEVPPLWLESKMQPFIDCPFFSCILGREKPDPHFYLELCSSLNVLPERCLYVGDGGSNELSGAQAVGMSPVRIRIEAEEAEGPVRYDEDCWSETIITSLSELIEYIS